VRSGTHRGLVHSHLARVAHGQELIPLDDGGRSRRQKRRFRHLARLSAEGHTRTSRGPPGAMRVAARLQLQAARAGPGHVRTTVVRDPESHRGSTPVARCVRSHADDGAAARPRARAAARRPGRRLGAERRRTPRRGGEADLPRNASAVLRSSRSTGERAARRHPPCRPRVYARGTVHRGLAGRARSAVALRPYRARLAVTRGAFQERLASAGRPVRRSSLARRRGSGRAARRRPARRHSRTCPRSRKRSRRPLGLLRTGSEGLFASAARVRGLPCRRVRVHSLRAVATAQGAGGAPAERSSRSRDTFRFGTCIRPRRTPESMAMEAS